VFKSQEKEQLSTAPRVFESRRPERQAWLEWARERSFARAVVPDIGPVETWVDVYEARGGLVSFRWTFVAGSDGTQLTSCSTLRFRSREELADSLTAAGSRWKP
jgi:hypothetical protein